MSFRVKSKKKGAVPDPWEDVPDDTLEQRAEEEKNAVVPDGMDLCRTTLLDRSEMRETLEPC